MLRLVELVEFKKPGPGRVEVQRDERGGLVSAVLRGVKVLGVRSANRNADGTFNVYPLETRRRALALYEGAHVNVDHPKSRTEVRSYNDRIGRLRAPVAREDGTFADLHVNPKHPRAEQLVWDAENAPDSLGLSHVAQGRGRIVGTDCVMEDLVAVESVDVVSRAATTRGLFEALRPSEPAGDYLVRSELLEVARRIDLLSVRAGLKPTATKAVCEAFKIDAPTPASRVGRDLSSYGTKNKPTGQAPAANPARRLNVEHYRTGRGRTA